MTGADRTNVANRQIEVVTSTVSPVLTDVSRGSLPVPLISLTYPTDQPHVVKWSTIRLLAMTSSCRELSTTAMIVQHFNET